MGGEMICPHPRHHLWQRGPVLRATWYSTGYTDRHPPPPPPLPPSHMHRPRPALGTHLHTWHTRGTCSPTPSLPGTPSC